MTEIATVAPDLAKAAFQIHCADTVGRPVLRKPQPRARFSEFFGGLSPCLVGIEACSSAHHRARELQALLAPRPTNVVPVATANKTARLGHAEPRQGLSSSGCAGGIETTRDPFELRG